MAKKKVSKMRITESVAEKLDAIADPDATEVYKAKKEENLELQFLEMLGEEEFGNKENMEEKVEKSKIFEIGLRIFSIVAIVGLVIIVIKMINI